MFRVCGLILFLIAGTISLSPDGSPQAVEKPDEEKVRLQIVIPESDSVMTDLSRYRISANTRPGGQAFINDREVRVYPSGAFVGLVPLDYGENNIKVTIITPDSLVESREMTIIRSHPMQTSSEDQLVIEDAMMQPSRDYWLTAGDVLNMRFKGSPGLEATFEIPGVTRRTHMRELPPSQTGGVRGIYAGQYKVSGEDYAENVRVRFRLFKNIFNSIDFESAGTVSIIPDKLPIAGRVTGRLPVLNAGVGTDRLGGTRLGFLQAGVMLDIDGKDGNMYRVRLAQNKTAWISSQFVELFPDSLSQRISGGVIIAGENGYNGEITLELGKRLPYITRQLVNPNRIIIDIYGVKSNTKWETRIRPIPGVRNITRRQVSEGHFSLQINLDHRVHWGHRVDYDGEGTLRVLIRRPPLLADAENVLRGRVIAIDAGHGGDNKGALGSTGVFEKDITLALSQMIGRKLSERGARVVMTRTDDRDVALRERVQRAAVSDAEIFLSIHCNSIGYASDPELIRGTSVYFKHEGFRPLAATMQRQMLALGYDDFGLKGDFNFFLNEMIDIPNVLIETAFLSNPEDEMRLIDSAEREKIAEAIVNGVEEYFRINGVLP